MSRWLFLALGFLAGVIAAYSFVIYTMFLPVSGDEIRGLDGSPVCFRIGGRRIGCIRVKGAEVGAAVRPPTRPAAEEMAPTD